MEAEGHLVAGSMPPPSWRQAPNECGTVSPAEGSADFRPLASPHFFSAATMSEADRKALKVKAGVVKRLCKELHMYQQEVVAEQAKVQRLKEQGADPHDIKYAVRRRRREGRAAAT